VGMQLNVFHASKLSVWLNYVKSHTKKRNMNHGKHVTPEDVSMSTNLNICNILLHGIKKYNLATIIAWDIFDMDHK
jgi:hypothetical protein